MENYVREVFFILMASVVAVILIFIFWGNDSDIVLLETSDSEISIPAYKGVLGNASDVVEESIAKYYYEYCFKPAVGVNDGTDTQLGYSSKTPDYTCKIDTDGLSATSTRTSTSTYKVATYSASYTGYTQTEENYK